MLNIIKLLQFFKGYQLEYVGKKQEGKEVYSFYFKPLSQWRWQAGQHMMLDFQVNGKIVRKMFSLSSAPFEENYRITTRYLGDKASDFKKTLFTLQQGTIIKGHGPVGNIKLIDQEKHHLFIAGGIGITPFCSILKDIDRNKLTTGVTLLYQNTDKNFVFENELNSIVKNNKDVKIQYLVNPVIIDTQKILNAVPNIKDTIVCISGPNGFVVSIKKILQEIGVKNNNIKTDVFLGLNI